MMRLVHKRVTKRSSIARGEFFLSPGHLKDLIPDIVDRDVYICGPPAMADIVDISVRRAGVPRRQIHAESLAFSPAPSGGTGRSALSSRARPALVAALGAAVAALLGRFAWLSTHPRSPTVAPLVATTVPTATRVASTVGPTATTPAVRAAPTPVISTFAGTTVQTQYGPVQVTLTARGKKITGVAAAIAPQDPRSQSIETQTVPILKQETLPEQSASVNTVSGATVVSDAYNHSLQSARSKAGI